MIEFVIAEWRITQAVCRAAWEKSKCLVNLTYEKNAYVSSIFSDEADLTI
jgi:hypothetical protein